LSFKIKSCENKKKKKKKKKTKKEKGKGKEIKRKIDKKKSKNEGDFLLMDTIHPGFFARRALFPDSFPSRKSTVASRVQFKPIKNGKNLVVNNNR